MAEPTVAAMGSPPRPGPAALDHANVGDITGALGTIRMADSGGRRSWRARILTLLAIVGPGLIVMVGDNDAGGVATYAQAGQDYGPTLLWTLVLLIPVLIVNQEMVVRLGAVTGVGHARLIKERFGRFWGAFSVGDLFVLNFLTIVTEFIGVRLAAGYFGISPYLVVPLAAVLLVAITASGNFRRWERAMLLFVVGSLLVVPLAVLSHPAAGAIAHGFGVPGVRHGFSSGAVLLIIAIVGTTVAPWQLFFQQSNVIDKRITPRWIAYERADTVIGALVVIAGAAALMIAAAHAFQGTAAAGHFVNAGQVAEGMARHVSGAAGAIFAVLLLVASIIGASAVTLATSYAFGDVFGLRHSLHRRFSEAKVFYGSYTAMVLVAAGVTLVPRAPLGVMTTAVQALAGVLLPSATVFLLLLCNDREVLGPWVNAGWLNVIASVIVGLLLVLSLILVVSTLAPSVNVSVLFVVLTSVMLAVLGAAGAALRLRRRPAGPAPVPRSERATWRMPPVTLLVRPRWSMGRTLGMWALRGYLLVAALLLVVKAAQLATAH
ncbi:MAG TPA: NRAMP family divalent metal transporter [Candidatus Micrarchaeia archaeon]|nr:NRAMP family divalent metal transporter [Candidatus Micrarchaeia archaeon]